MSPARTMSKLNRLRLRLIGHSTASACTQDSWVACMMRDWYLTHFMQPSQRHCRHHEPNCTTNVKVLRKAL